MLKCLSKIFLAGDIFLRKRVRNIVAGLLTAVVFAGLLIYGLNAEKEEKAEDSGSVIINEFMASNKSTIADGNGDYSDWIELYNPTDSSVNLYGYGLSDDSTSIKWAFPGVTMEPGGYLVVFAASASSQTSGFYHTGFKLSAEKGGIYLSDTTGAPVDSVEYEEQITGISVGRDADGQWTAMEPSPGFSNDEAGIAAFMESRKTDDEQIIITEVISQNRTTIADANGEFNDYIEIYNEGSTTVDLSGYKLSDDIDNIGKWTFPEVSIDPGQYLLIFASGAEYSESGDLQASFRISSLEETIVLSNPFGLIADSVTLREIDTDWSYSRLTGQDGSYTDEWQATGKPTPGLVNTSDGFASFMQTNVVSTGQVVINEAMVSNGSVLEEADGEYYDWIELYNRGDADVDLTGYSLSDDQNNPSKFKFDGKTIGAGKYLVVMASGDTETDEQFNYLHANFRLSGDGEVIALYNPQGVLQDRLILTYSPHDISIGRQEGRNELFYFEDATPGAANTNAYSGLLEAPQAGTSAGSYDSAVEVSLSCAQEGAKIYYTLDGGEPSQSDSLYSGPISIPQTGMIRARAYKDGFIQSEISTNTYFIGETHSLPLLSVVTENDYLFDPQTGIYMLGPNAVEIDGSPGHYKDANYSASGQEAERPASFEVFDESGQQVFAQNIGIRIQGGFSRDHAQKSFSIFARSEYGPGVMRYTFFDNRPFTEYQSIQLRQGGQDSNVAKIKEATILSLVEGQGFNFIYQAFKPYVLYINGEYWGVYYMQEKRNEDFIAQHEGVSDPDSMNIMKASSILVQGSKKEYGELISFVDSHDMSLKENFDYIAQYVDTDSFMDLIINQIWIANSDYANLEYYQILPDGKWKQIFYDFCWTFRLTDDPTGHQTLSARMNMKRAGSSLFNGFLDYKPWFDAFIERFAWTMDEVYDTDRVLAEIDNQANLIADEMPAERETFGGTVRNWEINVENMRKFARSRNKDIVAQLKATFNLSAEQKSMLEDAIAED